MTNKREMVESYNIDGLVDDFDDSDCTLKAQIDEMHERGMHIINPTMEVFVELAHYANRKYARNYKDKTICQN